MGKRFFFAILALAMMFIAGPAMAGDFSSMNKAQMGLCLQELKQIEGEMISSPAFKKFCLGKMLKGILKEVEGEMSLEKSSKKNSQLLVIKTRIEKVLSSENWKGDFEKSPQLYLRDR